MLKAIFQDVISDKLSFRNYEGRISHLLNYRMLLKDKTTKSRVTGNCEYQRVAFSAGNINIFQPMREQTSTQWRHSFTPYFRHICVLFPASAPRATLSFCPCMPSSTYPLRYYGLNPPRNFNPINCDSCSHSINVRTSI